MKKKRKKGAQKKGGENSPVSPPLDPRLNGKNNNNDTSRLYSAFSINVQKCFTLECWAKTLNGLSFSIPKWARSLWIYHKSVSSLPLIMIQFRWTYLISGFPLSKMYPPPHALEGFLLYSSKHPTWGPVPLILFPEIFASSEISEIFKVAQNSFQHLYLDGSL